ALALAGEVDEGAAGMLEAGLAKPWGGSMVAVVEGYRRFEGGDGGGLASVAEGTDRLLGQFDFDPLGRAVTASHVLNIRALAEVHAGRPSAALRTVQRIDALAPEP